jgi:hypothetical protein
LSSSSSHWQKLRAEDPLPSLSYKLKVHQQLAAFVRSPHMATFLNCLEHTSAAALLDGLTFQERCPSLSVELAFLCFEEILKPETINVLQDCMKRYFCHLSLPLILDTLASLVTSRCGEWSYSNMWTNIIGSASAVKQCCHLRTAITLDSCLISPVPNSKFLKTESQDSRFSTIGWRLCRHHCGACRNWRTG